MKNRLLFPRRLCYNKKKTEFCMDAFLIMLRNVLLFVALALPGSSAVAVG